MSILSLFNVTHYGQSAANNLTLFDFKQPYHAGQKQPQSYESIG